MSIRTGRTRKYLPEIAFLVLVAVLLFAACSGQVGPQGPPGPPGPQGPASPATSLASPSTEDESSAGYDFTLLATGGAASLVGDSEYQVTLTDVHHHVLAFQNRPNRGFGHMPVESLVSLWPRMFGDADGAPNASLISRDQNGESDDPIAFVMGIPTMGQADKSISFNAVLLDGSPAPIDSFTDVGLFIDPSSRQWAQIGIWCGAEIVLLIGSLIVGSASGGIVIGALVAANVNLTVACVNAISAADWG